VVTRIRVFIYFGMEVLQGVDRHDGVQAWHANYSSIACHGCKLSQRG
jgi:hypothetical protein